MSLIYLFRHGDIASAGRMVGRFDIPLSPLGEEQATGWGDKLVTIPFSFAWSSPLQRAMQTAALILAHNNGPLRAAMPHPGLVEISLGKWEGMDKTDVIRDYPDIWQKRGLDMVNTPPPGGESFSALASRVVPVFEGICREAAKHAFSLVVAHQAVNRAIIAHTRGIALGHMRDIPQPPCALTVFEVNVEGGGRTVKEEYCCL